MKLSNSYLASGRLFSLVLAFAIFGCQSGLSQIIPAGRTPPGGKWYAGVPGGIPYRTIIYKTLYPTNTAVDISAACQSCPSNEVVFLSTGTYYLNSAINWYNNLSTGNGVTLRGAGPTNTILVWSNTNYVQAPIQIQGGDIYGDGYPDSAAATNQFILSVASGYTQGSTSLTLSSPQNASLFGTHGELKAGTVICLDQLNDSFVNNIGSDSGFQLDASAIRDNGARAQQQYVVVQSISNGTNLTIWPPIYMTNYQASLQPQIWWWGTSMSMSGVEDLQLNVANSQHTYPILFWSCYACWARDVIVYKGANSAVYTYDCKSIEVRDSYFNQAQSYGSGSYGVQITLASDCLIENNIFNAITTPMMITQGASGNVFGYNFCTNGIYYDTNNAWMPPSIEPHYVHNDMNLFEGNYGTGVELDFTHGSGSHNTLFRNRLHGPERSTQLNNTFAIQIQATNWWMNVIGNVLGTVGWHTNYAISVTNPAEDNDASRSIYKFGFVDDGGSTNYGDPNAQATALIHGNWDAVTATNGGVVWNPAITNHSLPPSLYLTGQPSWWGNAPWPPFDPLNPSMSATNLPAAYRFMYGSNSVSTGVLPPVAVAIATVTSGPAPLLVNFSSTGSSDPEGATLSYNWAFGDGGTSTAANPSYTYSTVGTYTAQLNVSDGTFTTPATAISITVGSTLSGPVAAYGFNEGSGSATTDTSGNGNTGTITAATWTSTGKYGGALSFNGTNSVVTVADSSSLDLSGGMTLEAWVYPTALNAQQWMTIIIKPLTAQNSVDYALQGASMTSSIPSVGVSASAANCFGPSALPLNTWSHLAATYDGATMRLYVNGVQVASAAQIGAIGPSTQPLSIGSNWAGLIDELRVYNRALSAGQITTDMNTPVNASPAPPPPSNLRIVSF